MKTHDYSTTFLVDQTPAQAFDAITNVRGWWSEGIEGDTHRLDAEFVYQYKGFHRSTQKMVELLPGQKVVWLVTDSRLNFITNKAEWTGSKLCFEVTPRDGKTQVRFTHEGLVPDHECFDACTHAWTGYIQDSLRGLIVSGKGKPDPAEN
jgi:hypothetical protein